MRPLFIIPCVFLSASLFFAACKKSTSNDPGFTTGMDVYIAGNTDGKAVYWKNGKSVILADTGNATSMTLSGSDVFVAGQVGSAKVSAAYWKNGVQFTLPHTRFSTANGIGVQGADVYIIGNVLGNKDTITYWKNGQRFNFLPITSGSAYGIAISGADVYAIGRVTTTNGFDSTVVWKNGTRDRWVSTGVGISLNAILISGADMYLGASGFYLKNTEFIWLDKKNATITAIAVDGTDTYVCGYYYDNRKTIAAYWKNGVQTILADQYSTSSASGIAIAGNDLYVIGSIYSDYKYIPVYWKNGVMKELAGNGFANAIVVGK